jgi:hypothetical protein
MSTLAGAAEDAAIAHVLDRLYAVISFEEGDEPNWQELEQLFSRHARITRVTPDGTDYMDPQAFLAMTRNLLELGVYTSFYEFEVARRVQRFGGVAQVWSLYETRRSKTAARALGRGVNSIQLIQSDESWQVLGLLWDESKATPDLDFDQLLAPPLTEEPN